jgi:4'-phosphopantetheinyl transferase
MIGAGKVVHVWLIRVDRADGVLADLEAVLDEREQARAHSYLQAGHRRQYTVAHGAARLILARYLGRPPERLRWRRGRNGKPELAGAWTGLHVNLSHSGNLAAFALSHGRRIGVDVQAMLPHLDPAALSARYYPPGEAAFVASAGDPARQLGRFVRLWARKEACVKAAGGRLMQGLRLPVHGDVVQDPSGRVRGRYLVRDVPVPPGFRAAVALEGEQPFRLQRWWWSGPSGPDWGA